MSKTKKTKDSYTLEEALKMYNNALQTKPISHEQHDKILTAYAVVIQCYDYLLSTLRSIEEDKENFMNNHSSIMHNIVDKNPELLSFKPDELGGIISLKHSKKSKQSKQSKKSKQSKQSKQSRNSKQSKKSRKNKSNHRNH